MTGTSLTPYRNCLAAGVLLALGLYGTSVPRGRADLLLPDLMPGAPSGLEVMEAYGRRFLIFDTMVSNQGAGPLEIDPRTEDCDHDGNSGNDRSAYQIIYTDPDRDGSFARSSSSSSAPARYAGCLIYHQKHRHWHYDGLMVYELTSLADGETVRAAKMGFCLLDMLPLEALDRRDRRTAWHEPFYDGSDPGSDVLPCHRDALQGLSPGWADLYGSDTPGQRFDITDLGSKSYCLSYVVNDNGALIEESDTNNRASVAIVLAANPTVQVVGDC